jgi:hypothetical protein
MDALRLGPTAKSGVNRHQFKFWKLGTIFSQSLLTARPIEILADNVLPLLAIEILQIGFR